LRHPHQQKRAAITTLCPAGIGFSLGTIFDADGIDAYFVHINGDIHMAVSPRKN
jgi:hypothetical protein